MHRAAHSPSGEPSLAVEGVDVAAIDGAQTSQGVTWVDQVTLTGELADGILHTADRNSDVGWAAAMS